MAASDYKLHTLHLAEEWADLLTQLEMPKVQLPRVNPTRPSCHKQHGKPSAWWDRSCPPPTVFSAEVVAIVEELDAKMFEEWGYERREAPFEL